MELSASTFGYCTNVHANASLEKTRANLEQHALGVKRRISPNEPMGIGLWLSANAAQELVSSGQVADFAAWLREIGLVPFTMNGFPYGDFHEQVVKHKVYQPTWYEPARLDYTLQLAEILDQLLLPGVEGSISTLPIAWPSKLGEPLADDLLRSAAANLRRAAQGLAELETRTGRLIYVCIEPEPGCVLDTADDIVAFFQDFLLSNDDERGIRRHMRVCHDICHSAVMFEDQEEASRTYQAAGIEVGKVQVSSAVGVDFDSMPMSERQSALELLRTKFVEPRYLHQTCVRDAGQTTLYEDLPLAIAQAKSSGQWRTHFHVPIYWEGSGPFQTFRDQIAPCIQAVLTHSNCRHFEVETYAWGVLPPELQHAELAEGIAQEMEWFRNLGFHGGEPREKSGFIT
ncbi:MAG: metabolite traffic protein EboE [Pirellulaceae bacterium]|nr:metabolite traffic protein EboE [Pirellulaceae bacterium]